MSLPPSAGAEGFLTAEQGKRIRRQGGVLLPGEVHRFQPGCKTGCFPAGRKLQLDIRQVQQGHEIPGKGDELGRGSGIGRSDELCAEKPPFRRVNQAAQLEGQAGVRESGLFGCPSERIRPRGGWGAQLAKAAEARRV